MAGLGRLRRLVESAASGETVRALSLVSPLLLAAIGGCQLALDVEGTQCESDTDCLGLFGRTYVCTDERVCIEDLPAAPEDSGTPSDASSERPPQWQCLDEPRRTVIPQASRVVSVRLAVTDFVTLTSPDGLIGKACNPSDIPCANPVIANVMPDDEGYLLFPGLMHAWPGFIHLSAPGYIDTLVFTNRPYTGDEMPEGPTLLTEASLRSISQGGGEEIDDSKGVVLVAAYDCDGNAAPGVRIVLEEQDNDEHPFYFQGTLPDRDRETTVISTQLTRSRAPLAVGGYSHVKEGYATMIGVLEATGEEIGRVTVQVRPLTMSIAELNAGY